MASLKDRNGYGDGSQGSRDVEFCLSSLTWWVGSGCLSAQSASSFSLGRAWRLSSQPDRDAPVRSTSYSSRWTSLRLRRPRSRSTMTASR